MPPKSAAAAMMHRQEDRLASFLPISKPKGRARHGWPHTEASHPLLTPANMAHAGFYFSPGGSEASYDTCTCFLCGVRLGGWDADDDPWYEHASRGDCAWAETVCKTELDKRAGRTPVYTDTDMLPSSSTSSWIRQNTFYSKEREACWWPYIDEEDFTPQPETLAAAGFVYTPTVDSADLVTCPHCMYAVEGWEAEDEPLEIHRRRKATCPFFTAEVTSKPKRGPKPKKKLDEEPAPAPAPAPAPEAEPRRGHTRTNSRSNPAPPTATAGAGPRTRQQTSEAPSEPPAPAPGPTATRAKRGAKQKLIEVEEEEVVIVGSTTEAEDTGTETDAKSKSNSTSRAKSATTTKKSASSRKGKGKKKQTDDEAEAEPEVETQESHQVEEQQEDEEEQEEVKTKPAAVTAKKGSKTSSRSRKTIMADVPEVPEGPEVDQAVPEPEPEVPAESAPEPEREPEPEVKTKPARKPRATKVKTKKAAEPELVQEVATTTATVEVSRKPLPPLPAPSPAPLSQLERFANIPPSSPVSAPPPPGARPTKAIPAKRAGGGSKANSQPAPRPRSKVEQAGPLEQGARAARQVVDIALDHLVTNAAAPPGPVPSVPAVPKNKEEMDLGMTLEQWIRAEMVRKRAEIERDGREMIRAFEQRTVDARRRIESIPTRR